MTLNRPEAMNAANEALHGALQAGWGHPAKDTDARVVVLTGAGRAFRAGGDFNTSSKLRDDRPARREIDGARRLNMHVKRAMVGVLRYALSEGFALFETAEHQALVTVFLHRAKAKSR